MAELNQLTVVQNQQDLLYLNVQKKPAKNFIALFFQIIAIATQLKQK